MADPARILIIEDEALIARELQNRLKHMGWEVVGTAFGEEAVELAIERRPDLILSDINLRHGLSGIDVTQRIQKSMDVPVVFLTAYSDKDTVARAKSVTPFGYIIKPVDNRDLQITIEMALYKFRAEKELKEKQQLLETALACIGSALFFVDESGHVQDANADAHALIGETIADRVPVRRLFGENHPAIPAVSECIRDKTLVKLSPFLMHRATGSTKLVDGVVGPMDHGVVIILRDLGDIEDAVPQEPMEQYAQLGAELLSPSESTFCQLLIAPDELNDGARPALLEETRQLLDSHLRSTDLISVFGNSLLSISLPYTRLADGEVIAASLLARLANFRFNGQAVKFSAGLANTTGGEQEPIELFQRASAALEMARRMGGGQLWTERRGDLRDNTDLGSASSYRQVVLLWNVLNTLSTAPDLDTMCAEFCRHLFHVFDAERVALLAPEDQQVSLRAAYVKGTGRTEHISDLSLNAREFAVIQGVSSGDVKDQILHNTLLFNVADQWVLLLSGANLREDDHSFFASICTYLAVSLARFAMVEEDETTQIEQSGRELIYASPEMKQVLETADLAAPTDATVLLFGESGTGKELVARYIHNQGLRRDHPLVVVDCGAVSPTLIESELFGHVKGAFTGATANFNGRLKEANGGTVLLDEIGELPLDTQVKLLRFVQDRQIAPVGSNQYESVDARVIAATHRDLREMVEQGEFREDLYYRLNVFTVSVPPLRDRTPDIMKIAEHYLGVFATRYRKSATEFSSEAKRELLAHGWPGNIRELSNVIHRAVILSKDNFITPIQLGLFSKPSEVPIPAMLEDEPLRQLIRQAVDLGISGRDPMPVGRYLEEDFILRSVNSHQGVLNRAATSISMPESTLRRKILKIEEDYGVTGPARPESWPVGGDFYTALMRLAATRDGQPITVLMELLVEDIEARNLNKTTGARLLGVSMPTYRKLVEEGGS